jgi:hypothetical protein
MAVFLISLFENLQPNHGHECAENEVPKSTRKMGVFWSSTKVTICDEKHFVLALYQGLYLCPQKRGII